MGTLPRLAADLQAAYPDLDRSWWPVDAPYHGRHGTDPRFEVVLGAILTQNTTWANVERALARLKAARLMDPQAIVAAPQAALVEAIRPAGSYNQKARYLRAVAGHIVDAYEGRLAGLFARPTDDLRRELLALPGIGPETADDVLVYAADRPSFIVDAYTRRLMGRYVASLPAATYASTQCAWHEAVGLDHRVHAWLHAAIVEHAKYVCTAREPACGACALRPACAQRGVAQS